MKGKYLHSFFPISLAKTRAQLPAGVFPLPFGISTFRSERCCFAFTRGSLSVIKQRNGVSQIKFSQGGGERKSLEPKSNITER